MHETAVSGADARPTVLVVEDDAVIRCAAVELIVEAGFTVREATNGNEAIRILEAGGGWTEDVPEHIVLALAWALLGEVLKELAASDEVVFGDDPARFAELVAQSRAAFARAHAIDPSDTASLLNAKELEQDEEPEAAPEELN